MTLQQLNYVIKVAEVGSLNRAAEALYLSQPSLTEAIKELERELGFAVFNRSSRGVTLTGAGEEFLIYARQVCNQYETLEEKFIKGGNFKKKFCVSAQHYSFAVKAFVETVKKFDTLNYEYAIRETRTATILSDVSSMRSEIGILYLSDFNRKAVCKLLEKYELEFHSLILCRAYAYLWKGHPLAQRASIYYKDLSDYPCLIFEQGEGATLYFAEEVLSPEENPRTIRACDRATMLNLMVGLNGYTVCSGIICEELNGGDYVAVPIERDNPADSVMEVGYIMRKNVAPSDLCLAYIQALKDYLKNCKND